MGSLKWLVFFPLQNIFITFSRHNYGKTEWDLALTGKEKSAKYFSKNLLLTKGTFKSNASISIFQQCPSPQDNAGHLQDVYALEWAICTFHINLGVKHYPILRHWVGHLAQPKIILVAIAMHFPWLNCQVKQQ